MKALSMLLESQDRSKNVVVGGDFIGHIGSNRENDEDQHGGYGYRLRNKEG